MGTVRLLLALCVVVTHGPDQTILGLSLLSGITAVQCFYVISGFLITMILNERKEYRSLGSFYLSRYLRLWPVYILVAALSLIVSERYSEVSTLPSLVGWSGAAFVGFSNLTLFFQDWFLFIRFDDGHFIPTSAFGMWPGPQAHTLLLVPQCWTLGVELTFYAIAPFVCRRWWSALGLFAFGAIARLVVVSFHPPALDPWLYRFAPSEMMMFGAGATAYFAGRIVCPRFPRATKLIGAVSIVGFAGIVFGSDLVQAALVRYVGGVNQRLLLLFWPILALMSATAPALFYATRNSRLDRLLGEMSYPMYVCHLLVRGLFARYAAQELDPGNLLYVSSTVAFSLLIIFAVIAPIDRLRKTVATAISMRRNTDDGAADAIPAVFVFKAER